MIETALNQPKKLKSRKKKRGFCMLFITQKA